MGSHPEHVEPSIKSKFTVLFEKINEPNYVMDSYYSDNLINKLIETRKDNNYICVLSHLLGEPIQNLNRYHISVQVFLIRSLGFVCSKELFFAKLIHHINDTLRKGYTNLGSPTMNPSLSVAYLEVALSLVEHYTSLYWLLDSGMWKEILRANESKTVFVTRQKYKFVSRLVWRLNGLEDEANLKQVLTFILKPLIETEIVITESITTDEEELSAKQFEPMLHMLNSIMNDYKELSRSSLVINMLLTHFKVVNQMYVLLDRYRKDSLTSPSAKLIFRLILAKIFNTKPMTDNSTHTAEDFIETSAAYFNTVNVFLQRRNPMAVLDYCYSCNEIWNATWDKKIPRINTLNGKKVDLQNKMLFLCLVPAISYITRYMPDNAFQMAGNIQDYMMKLINASCEHTAKTAWALSRLILELDTETIVLQSVKRLASLNNSMNNEQANLMFQGLFYVLKQFDPMSEGHHKKCPEAMFQEDQENLFLYTYALEAVLLLVKNYDINWQESLEIICLYNVVFNILQKTNLSSKGGATVMHEKTIGDTSKGLVVLRMDKKTDHLEMENFVPHTNYKIKRSGGFKDNSGILKNNYSEVTMGNRSKSVESVIKMKFKSLFEKINEPNYVIDNFYSDNLINKLLENKPELNVTCSVRILLEEPVRNLERYHVSVRVFLVRLLALVVREELCFAKVIHNINDPLAKAYQTLESPTMTPSLRVAYLEVALAIIEHNTGFYWLLESGMWKEILSINDQSNTVFVTRQKYKFVSKLVWRLNALEDDDNVRQVLNFILKPLVETDIEVTESMKPDEEEEASKWLEPMLLMLVSITNEYSELTKSSLVINALLNHFKLANHLCVLLDRFRKNSLTSLLANLIFRIYLAKTLHNKPLADDTVYRSEDFVETTASYFNTIHYFTIRRKAMMVLDFCYSCNEYWNGLWRDRKPLTIIMDGKKENLQNKALFMCLVPPICYVTRRWPKAVRYGEGCIQDYIMKLINASCEHTAKAGTLLSDLVLESDVEAIALKTVKRLSSLNNSMNNEQANLIFQGLFYVIKHLDPDPEHFEYRLPSSDAKLQEDQENMFVYSYVIEAILNLIKEFHINWHESLEVICLYTVVFRIMSRPNLPCKFIVTALNVITVTVCKFLPPNLSLLMESKPGSAMHDLGRLIYMKMHDLHWEVRDSALELLLVVTEISYVKFPPFQKQIIENELIVVATAVALNDHEFYVRASALRCLGSACKVSTVWEQLKTKHPDIQVPTIEIVVATAVALNDHEFYVRASALRCLGSACKVSTVWEQLKTKHPDIQIEIVLATAVALNDHEFYVRASALRCLGSACKVSTVWEQLKTKHPDIQDSLLNILCNNQEGIVRKEACNVLCEMYLNLKLCPEFKQALYEQMVSSAVSDFHWEVQLAALKFWKIVIHNNLCEQGMLDGTFPPVTFSKESRKIVTLNKAEIQRRLLKILDELSAKGCLTVLSKLLHEDTEVEIMDANLAIALNLLDILKRYEVPECVKRVEGEPRTMQEYYTETKEDAMDQEDVIIKTEDAQSDNVIEGIINADDMNLLAHIYERHMKLQNDKPELQPKPMIKLLRYVKPYLFVNHLMSKDFKAVIEYKKQWRNGIRSVESLLDDVLGIYEVGNDVNNLDCY
ncbi:uncharacterized protein LOC134667663 [Cydia fagiglandana]|uniref:uncharacterized protein LOC134667663 n=1 Tax=Cydia fagiglandana TaxID=1458189 RepID=UPI002FEE51A8